MNIEVLSRIEQRLSDLGLSASAASKRAGVSVDAIRNIRRSVAVGKKSGISTQTLGRLAVALETTPSWLLEGQGDLASAKIETAAGRFEEPSSTYTPASLEAPVAGSLQLEISADWTIMVLNTRFGGALANGKSLYYVDRADNRLSPGAVYICETTQFDYFVGKFCPTPDRLLGSSETVGPDELFLSDMTKLIGRVRLVQTLL